MSLVNRTQAVFPPDAGSTNNGTTPTVGKCGRGILRTGDIRHKGDNIGPQLTGEPTITLTPGTTGFNTSFDHLSGEQFLSNTTGNAQFQRDGQSDGKWTTFSGGDASGEGFDAFSGKLGRES